MWWRYFKSTDNFNEIIEILREYNERLSESENDYIYHAYEVSRDVTCDVDIIFNKEKEEEEIRLENLRQDKLKKEKEKQELKDISEYNRLKAKFEGSK